MKNKHILAVLILGIITVIGGAALKIMHIDGANAVLATGLIIEGICGLLLIVKLLKGNKNSQSFLDS